MDEFIFIEGNYRCSSSSILFYSSNVCVVDRSELSLACVVVVNSRSHTGILLPMNKTACNSILHYDSKLSIEL